MGKLTGMQVKLIRMPIGTHVIWNDIHTGHLVFLFPLHPPVLEPNFYLSLSQTECVRYLYPSPPREVPVEVELFL